MFLFELFTQKTPISYPRQWYDISLGPSKGHISLAINTQKKLLSTEIYIPDSIEFFIHLKEHKEEIKNALKESLEWMELPDKKASRVRLCKDFNLSDNDFWEENLAWLLNKAKNFHKIFSQYQLH